MIKNTTARAMQISTMDDGQIKRLHDKESKLGYYLPNWNIQKLFYLGAIKDIYGIPEDDLSEHIQYQNRIDADIDRIGARGMIEGAESGLDWLHAFDWAIFNNRDQIIWEHSKKGGGLLQRLSKAMPAILLLLAK